MSEDRQPKFAPLILRLTIERFRGIEKLIWHPSKGLNVILGGGDVGKTTVLEAIGLLLHPANSSAVSDSDYWRRIYEDEFLIEAVMLLPPECGIDHLSKHAWPWEWDGKDPKLPNLDGESGESVAHPVYRMRVRGTADFDIAYEILQPDQEVITFSVALRHAIGLVRLGGDDRNDRDLRLVQGSALDRLLADKTFRSKLGHQFAQIDVLDSLKEEAKAALQQLDEVFQKKTLPSHIKLGFVGGPGLSAGALVGLTAEKDGVPLPLANWGAGTRRLAALEIAGLRQSDKPITLVDEVERGLEPYRQRTLVASLQQALSQCFSTTHSAPAVAAATEAALWYMDASSQIGSLASSVVRDHQRSEPEMFLAKLAIVGEGKTEIGFVSDLLEKTLEIRLQDHGIWIADGGGDDKTVKLLGALCDAGLTFGGFADNEGKSPALWKKIQEKIGPLLFRWKEGCIESSIINLAPIGRLEEFIEDPKGELTGERLRTLADRVGKDTKDFATITAATTDIRALIIQAATGFVPPEVTNDADKKAYRKHGQKWFKTIEGGRELYGKLFTFGLVASFQDELLKFVNAVGDIWDLEKKTALRE